MRKIVKALKKLARMKSQIQIGDEELSLLNPVRSLLIEMTQSQAEFQTSDLFRLAYENRQNLPGLEFKYGTEFPYSGRLEDIVSLLLLNGDLQISPSDSCKLVVSEHLKARYTPRAASAAAH